MPIFSLLRSLIFSLQELYRQFLSDADFKNDRFSKIAASAGIGPKKLARCLERGKAARLII